MTRLRGTLILAIAAAAGLAYWGCAEDGSRMLMGACGDGHIDPGEACDDDNLNDGDGCSAMCTIEGGTLPTLASIQATIFSPVCSACHFPQGTAQFMPLHTEDASYESLVLSGYSFLCSGPRVDPGDPDNSCLVLKLEGSSQAGGEPMPPRPIPALSAEEIGAIRQWISNGAPR